jgi:SulP family sulfate permease
MSEEPPGDGRGAAVTHVSTWRDVAAGLSVAGLLLPEAVAYAGLARLPAVHGLTAALAGLAIYALFGRSRFAIVAPTSSTATLAAAAVLTMQESPGAAADPVAYAQALLALTLLAGAALLVLAWARQGQLSSFVSRPVLRGFAFALAITIVVKQLPDTLGLALPRDTGADPWHVLEFALTHARDWHAPSIAVALVAGLGVAAVRRWSRWPASLLVMVLAIVAAYGLDLHAMGVAEVGRIEHPTLSIGVPDLPTAEWLRAGELATGLVVLVFAESWGSMRTMALQHGDTLDANRELWVLGACNVGAALLQGMPVGAGFSATAANATGGASSRRAGAAAWLVMALAIAFALPALQLLPRPVLAVAVISALWHALSVRPLLSVWRMRRDRTLVIAAVAAVLVLGVLYGMLVAIAISLIDALRRFSQPVVHELGRLGSSRDFVVLADHPNATALPGLLILRPEAPLFFASAERAVVEIMGRMHNRPALSAVIVSLEESADLDSTAVECLIELRQRLQGSGIELLLARVKESVRELLGHCDPQGIGLAGRMYWSVDDAAQTRTGPPVG